MAVRTVIPKTDAEIDVVCIELDDDVRAEPHLTGWVRVGTPGLDVPPSATIWTVAPVVGADQRLKEVGLEPGTQALMRRKAILKAIDGERSPMKIDEFCDRLISTVQWVTLRAFSDAVSLGEDEQDSQWAYSTRKRPETGGDAMPEGD